MAIKTTTTVTGKVVTYDTDTGRIISEESPTTPSSPTVSSSSSGSSGSSGSSSNSNMDNIANANPSEKANKAFVDALFQEKYNRNATSAEVTKFKKNTVKDASNLVLGQADSPFKDVVVADEVVTETPKTLGDSEMTFEELLKYKDRLIDGGIWSGLDLDEKKEINAELENKYNK